jgi:hypothetical protein
MVAYSPLGVALAASSAARSQSPGVVALHSESSSGSAMFKSVIGISGIASFSRLSSRSAATQEYANLGVQSVF